MPSRGSYSETHSCSTFHEFQARRLNIKYQAKDGKKYFAHKLNNTAIAPKKLIPLLEHYQNDEEAFPYQKSFIPFMGGIEKIVKK
jgi:seryl-tRNA synthetase